MRGKIVFRRLNNSDLDRLTELTSEAFKGKTKKQMKKILEREAMVDGEAHGLEVDGNLVSSGRLIFPILRMNGFHWKCGGVIGVCTDSRLRSKGLATRLMAHLIARMRDLGVPCSILFTKQDNPARSVYKKVGYSDLTANPVYVKVLDKTLMVKNWIRIRNRRLAFDRKARDGLKGWRRVIRLNFTDWRDVLIKFTGNTLKIVEDVSEYDIEIVTNLATFLTVTNLPFQTRTTGDRWSFTNAVNKKNIAIDCVPRDREMIKRFLVWDWV